MSVKNEEKSAIDEYLDGCSSEEVFGKSEMADACPLLWKLFSESPPGPKGGAGFSMSVTYEGPDWKVALNLKCRKKVAFLTLCGVSEIFDTVEESLARNKVYWKDSQW